MSLCITSACVISIIRLRVCVCVCVLCRSFYFSERADIHCAPLAMHNHCSLSPPPNIFNHVAPQRLSFTFFNFSSLFLFLFVYHILLSLYYSLQLVPKTTTTTTRIAIEALDIDITTIHHHATFAQCSAAQDPAMALQWN